LWKLTDFGFTSDAMSAAKTSLYGRGTSGYRAPELLNSEHHFSNRSDMWALGCILHELATGHRLFRDDFAAFKYYDSYLPAEIPYYVHSDNFWERQFSEAQRHFLSKSAHARPSARHTCRSLSAYCTVLELPAEVVEIKVQDIDPELEWRNLVRSDASIEEVLFHLAASQLRLGHRKNHCYLIDNILAREREFVHGFHSGTRKMQRNANEGDFWRRNAAAWRDIVQRFFAKKDYDNAGFICKQLFQNAPGSEHTLIIRAVGKDDLFAISFLLKLGQGGVNGGPLAGEIGDIPLHLAAQRGNLEAVRLLIELGADVNKPNTDGATALERAAERSHEKVIEELLRHEADVNHGNIQGTTSLHWAACKGYERVVELLLQHKADVNIQDFEGWTALCMAAEKKHTKVAEILVRHQADVDKQNVHGATALIWAALNGHKEIAEMLLHNNACVDKQDKQGRTALHCAASSGLEEMVKLLSEHKADMDKQDKDGCTALHWGAKKGHVKVIEMLLKQKPDIDKCKKDGETALDLAVRRGHHKVAEILREYKAGTWKPPVDY
jgi:ankyrin repeat protein